FLLHQSIVSGAEENKCIVNTTTTYYVGSGSGSIESHEPTISIDSIRSHLFVGMYKAPNPDVFSPTEKELPIRVKYNERGKVDNIAEAAGAANLLAHDDRHRGHPRERGRVTWRRSRRQKEG
ncbi:hypothetical protein PFISCL1PPCAC_4652, partial [Pristionchus fissidentatus]